MKIKCLTIIIIAGLFCRCSPSMEIPSYIWVDSVSFQITDATIQGTASHKITDVWISANGKSLGVYQLPARIPILEYGATNLSIDAGILLGGVPQIRQKYPFYASYNIAANLKRGEIDTLQPHFTYTNNVNFYLIEDFETAGMLFQATDKSAPLSKTSDKSLLFYHPKEDNGYSGIIELPHTGDSGTVYHFDIRTINPVNLNDQSLYYCLMEINFCITHHVEIGMISHSANSSIPDRQIPLANLSGLNDPKNEKPVWKKVYVNFTMAIGEGAGYQMRNFDIYIRSTIPSNEKATYLFDNIKLLYN